MGQAHDIWCHQCRMSQQNAPWNIPQKWWFGSNGFSFSMVVIMLAKPVLENPSIFAGAFLAVSFGFFTPISGDIMAPLAYFSVSFGGKSIATNMTRWWFLLIFFGIFTPLFWGR